MEREPYRPGLGQNQSLVRQLRELQKNPRSLVFVTLAESYRVEALPHQALEILEEGLAHHPDLASAMICKARCLFDLRRFAEASTVCRVVLRGNSANIKAQKLLADIYVRLGQRRAAIRALSQLLTIFPQDREAARALEELENLESPVIIPPEKISRASSDIAPTLGLIQDFHVHSFQTALSAATESEMQAIAETVSRAELQPVLAPALLSPDDGAEPTFATRTIAELYLRQGLKSKALRVIRKILQENPTHAWARETLQDLGSDGIVPLAQKSPADSQRAALTAKARLLEQMLAQVRLRRAPG